MLIIKCYKIEHNYMYFTVRLVRESDAKDPEVIGL